MHANAVRSLWKRDAGSVALSGGAGARDLMIERMPPLGGISMEWQARPDRK